MNCCKHKYFVIYRGDDTDFPGNQELIIELNTERDLTGCSAHFSFQGFTQDFAEIPPDKKLRLVIPNSETGKFAIGAADAKLWITNGTKIRTIENRIHVVVTNRVDEAYDNDDPQAITVVITGGGVAEAKEYTDAAIAVVDHKASVAQNTADAAKSEIARHASNTDNPHEVKPSQIGLGNVDNTADADKPVSTAQQDALDRKLDKSDVVYPNILAKEGQSADAADTYKEILDVKSLAAEARTSANNAKSIADNATEIATQAQDAAAYNRSELIGYKLVEHTVLPNSFLSITDRTLNYVEYNGSTSVDQIEVRIDPESKINSGIGLYAVDAILVIHVADDVDTVPTVKFKIKVFEDPSTSPGLVKFLSDDPGGLVLGKGYNAYSFTLFNNSMWLMVSKRMLEDMSAAD